MELNVFTFSTYNNSSKTRILPVFYFFSPDINSIKYEDLNGNKITEKYQVLNKLEVFYYIFTLYSD